MGKALVSILLPVYNVEKYLVKCLDSVLNQTLTNIEVIAVNDGSTDNSESILAEYAAKDSRFTYITKENGGLPSARNAGIKIAKGKYVAFVDSDDYIEPDMMEKMYKAAERDNSEIVICGANIFPEEPRANQWLYDCLSPKGGFYPQYDPSLLFDRVDTSPFLWRCMVKRSLIIENELSLDEDIILGEDKAFQCKLYPRANGITVIEDKLYNYYWCRSDSLMSQQVYENKELKVLKHAKLVGRIGEDIIKLGKDFDRKENRKAYIEWSIPFIYSDFIYLSLENKLAVANELTSAWEKCGYYSFVHEIPQWKQDAFDYISQFKIGKPNNANLSIIIPLEYQSRYLDEMIETIEQFDSDEVEILLVNNGVDSFYYTKILKIMKRQNNIRLFNTPYHFSYAECLNCANSLAIGKYILFMESHDWLVSKERVLEWVDSANVKNADVSVCQLVEKRIYADQGEKKYKELTNLQDLYGIDYHCALYRNEFLKNNKIEFAECSVITGYKFICEILSLTRNIDVFSKEVYYVREMHHADWLSTQKCISVLNGLDSLADLSLKQHNVYLHGSIFSILNGDKLKQIIVNNTKPYLMPSWQCPNGENSQIEVVEKLLSITEKADIDMLLEYGFDENKGYIDTLYEVIEERQKFLANLSNEYCE